MPKIPLTRKKIIPSLTKDKAEKLKELTFIEHPLCDRQLHAFSYFNSFNQILRHRNCYYFILHTKKLTQREDKL